MQSMVVTLSIKNWAILALKKKGKPPLNILNNCDLNYFIIDMDIKIMYFPIRKCHFSLSRYFLHLYF